jgi:ketosteroid isomerase-like protein
MKNQLISLVTLALLTLVACKQPVAVEESESPDYAAFDKKVEAISALYQAHSDEDLEALKAMVSDTMTWDPPYYNDNTLLGKEEFIAATKGYHDAFENLKYTAGIVTPDTLINGFWSGSVFPKENANSDPNTIRVYGTWTATHTESGKETAVKWFSLVTFNEDGKLVNASDYWDYHGLAAQIAAEEE